MNKTSILIGLGLVSSLLLVPAPAAAAVTTVAGDGLGGTCDQIVDIVCEDGAYTWCSANDGGPGYPSSTGTCAPGYQPQPRSGHICGVYSSVNNPPLCLG